jgi:two-component system sensor histidine kinase ComP
MGHLSIDKVVNIPYNRGNGELLSLDLMRDAMDSRSDRNYPKIITYVTSPGFQTIFVLLTLCLTIYYNIAFFLYVPATGVWVDYENTNRNSTVISEVVAGSPGEKAGLKAGDRIITIDGHSITNLNIPVHQPKSGGEIELYVVQRDQQILTIPLQVGSYWDHLDYLANIIPLQLLSLLMYILGVILLFFSPTSDIRARLVAIVLLLAGVAIAATGPGYTSCAWFAPHVARLAFAFSIFISTAAHLYFPITTFSVRTRNTIIWALFCLSILLTIAYLIEQISFAVNNHNPASSIAAQAISYPFYLLWFVNIGLLFKNRYFVKDNDIKRQTNIIFLGTLLGFLPFLLFSELPYLLFGPESKLILLPSEFSILFLIFVPISYGYVIYQRRLLKIDFIINRALVLFLMTLTILFTSLAVLGMIVTFFKLPSIIAIIGSLLSALIALPAATLQKKIQVQVDRVLYGGFYDYATVTSYFSNRLAQPIDRPTFITLLTDDLPLKMKIKESAILLINDNNLELQKPDNLPFSVQISDDICEIISSYQEPIHAETLWSLASLEFTERWHQFAWAKIIVPIVHRGTLYGILLLGERITGDIYSNQDLNIIGTIGQQAALSIANITLVEALRGLTQQLVRSDEEQRKKVARDLHDSVLQDLFFVKQRVSRSDPEAACFIDDIITTLRQIIKAQRPSLLDRGLLLALQDLINDLSQLIEDDKTIVWQNFTDGEIALTDEETTSIYRIVQESLSNGLKHSHADKIIITAKKEKNFFEVRIEDDGIGIESKNFIQIENQYGLLGLKERATMIGADLSIESKPGKGTVISVRLKI